jgi:hypothetical protein
MFLTKIDIFLNKADKWLKNANTHQTDCDVEIIDSNTPYNQVNIKLIENKL